MSKKVPIEEVTPGMVIDKDVTNPQGAILLRKGCEITDRHIGVFKTWGIRSLFIESELTASDLGGRDPQEVAQEEIAAEEKILEHKYAGFEDDEIMQLLKTCTLNHKSAAIKSKYKIK